MSSVLLTENENRYVIFPIKHQDIWEMFQLHRKTIWSESEIDVSTDLRDWKNLKETEKHFIKHVLAFFAASDGIVLENLALRFFGDVQLPEARSFYSIQMFMETVHGIMYSQLLDTYIEDADEKKKLFNAISTIPSIKQKALWAKKWIESVDDFAIRLVAFVVVEGLFFSGSFCCIYWLKERGILQGLCKSNDLISRDESIHQDFGVLLFTKYVDTKPSEAVIKQIVKEAVDIEEYFVTEALSCSLIGMNANMMKEYIRFVANRILRQLGYTDLYEDVKQPFSFMDRICFDSKDNFFEGRVTSYQLTVEKVKGDEVDNLDFDADF